MIRRKDQICNCKEKLCFFKEARFLTLDNLDKLTIFRCDYDNICYSDNLFDVLNISFPSSIASSVVKRRAEFLAGRFASKSALDKLKIDFSEIGIGKHRCPIWPDEIVASITHTETTAFCAAAYKQDIQYLGIDFEHWLNIATVQEIKTSVIGSSEEELLLKTNMDFNRAFTLAFSAKESLFKALYPSVGFYFDFLSVEIINIYPCDRKFELILRQHLTPELTFGRCFSGYFDYDRFSLLCLVVE